MKSDKKQPKVLISKIRVSGRNAHFVRVYAAKTGKKMPEAGDIIMEAGIKALKIGK